MSNHCDRRLLRSLILSAMDNLNQVSRARELIDILWDIQGDLKRDEKDWDRVEILLECYEQKRDEYLELAFADLEELRQIV